MSRKRWTEQQKKDLEIVRIRAEREKLLAHQRAFLDCGENCDDSFDVYWYMANRDKVATNTGCVSGAVLCA